MTVRRCRRRAHFRGLRVALECGHEVVQSTGLYRLTEARVACLAGALVRRGVWCSDCEATCQPVRFLGTTRLE